MKKKKFIFFFKNFLPKIKFEPYISFINITLKYITPDDPLIPLEQIPEPIKPIIIDEKKSINN